MKTIALFIFLLSTILSACAPVTMRSPSTTCDKGNIVFVSEVEILLCYFDSLSSMPDQTLEREHKTIEQRLKGFSYDRDRIRLAMLLSIPNTRFNDSAQALNLIKAEQGNTQANNPSVIHLLTLLRTLISEQIELQHERRAPAKTTSISTLKTRMKDYNLRQKVEVLEKVLLEEKTRSEELNAKIEALQMIDSSIDARRQPTKAPEK